MPGQGTTNDALVALGEAAQAGERGLGRRLTGERHVAVRWVADLHHERFTVDHYLDGALVSVADFNGVPIIVDSDAETFH